MQNTDIRQAVQRRGLKLWEVAEGLGIVDATLSRWLRREFSPELKEKTMAVIEQLVKQREETKNRATA